MRRLVALALCATSAAAAAVAHSLDNFVRPGVHHASFFDVDASVSAQTSAEGLDVIWANHLDETAMDVRETPDGLRLDYDVVSNSKKTGLIMVGRVGADPSACADAAYVSLEYRVLEASSRPGAARLRRGAALSVSGVAEPKHLKKMTSPFPCGILSLRNLLFA